jgi:hypothetical protein
MRLRVNWHQPLAETAAPAEGTTHTHPQVRSGLVDTYQARLWLLTGDLQSAYDRCRLCISSSKPANTTLLYQQYASWDDLAFGCTTKFLARMQSGAVMKRPSACSDTCSEV